MCGIVGCIGTGKANQIVLEGLNRLEYRGYDSCGIGYLNQDGKIVLGKSINRVRDLTEKTKSDAVISIGHTRWATHGGVNETNAHPHQSFSKRITLVHNGVIENFEQLIKQYDLKAKLKSETDTEVLAYVLEVFLDQALTLEQAIEKLIEVVHGSYALVILDNEQPDYLYVVKNKSPILIGRGQGLYTVSSDPSAVIDQVSEFMQLADHTYARVSKTSLAYFDQKGASLDPKFEEYILDDIEMNMQDYDTFMLKEIEEQPKVLQNMVDIYENLNLDPKLLKTLKSAAKIYIVASGTSYNSGLVCKKVIEKLLKIPVECVLGSEFGYEQNLINEQSVFLFLSQSGETADSMLVFNQVKDEYPIIAITNVRGSQMDRNADYSLLLYAGMEVAVASTKAYTAQIALVNILINLAVGNQKIFSELLKIKVAQEQIIERKDELEQIAIRIMNEQHIFYVGRLIDYALCQEASLKLKEISYINVSAFAAGELKHGTISLIEKGTKVLSLISNANISANTRSNNQEIKARGGEVITFSTIDCAVVDDDFIIDVNGESALSPLVTIIPHQYLAYFVAKKLNLDVDKPRNLAKAVTVE
ncbi:MAG: glutamine--fructose-6-phosphate transaminase (isomerizing) [Mycoplasmatales bacterium]